MRLTREQRVSLKRIYERPTSTADSVYRIDLSLRGYRRFRRTVQPGPGCVMVRWQGMWLGIEEDGYVHS